MAESKDSLLPNSQSDKIPGKLHQQRPQVNHDIASITRTGSKTLNIERDKLKKKFEELSQEFEILKEIIIKYPHVQVNPDTLLKLMESVKMLVNEWKARDSEQQCFSGGYSSSLKYIYKSKIKILMFNSSYLFSILKIMIKLLKI